MSSKEKVYSGENLEAILAVMEVNLFEQNEDFSAEIYEIEDEIGETQPACSFSCDQCDKIRKTQQI